MRRALAPLILLALAGCVTSQTPALEPAAAPAGAEGWTATGSATLGWVAAAGTHVFAGDLAVGVRSHDRCPEATFIVPEGAAALVVEATPAGGAGAWTFAVSGPDEVTYLMSHLQEMRVEREAPAPGVWSLEFKPQGALVQQAWETTVEIRGEGTAPLAEVPLQLDGDCLL